MKLGLKKAYDTVSWQFIEQMLDGVGFPKEFRDLIIVCVKTLMYGGIFMFF